MRKPRKIQVSEIVTAKDSLNFPVAAFIDTAGILRIPIWPVVAQYDWDIYEQILAVVKDKKMADDVLEIIKTIFPKSVVGHRYKFTPRRYE